MTMPKDYAIALAWPEGMVIAAGAWYDKFLSKKGKYRVGHAAVILIDSTTKKCHYFDMGRYHTPHGIGRIRDLETDPDILIKTKAIIKDKKIENIEKILIEISNNQATHGEGALYASIISNISFEKAYKYGKSEQKRGGIPYGPFIRSGTNCSRFVATIIKKSGAPIIKSLRLSLPYCISPSPKRNITITNQNYYIVRNQQCQYIKRNYIKAYFSGIEKKDESKKYK